MTVNFEILKRVLSCAVFTGFLNSVFWAIAAHIHNSISPPSGIWGEASRLFLFISIVMGVIVGFIAGGLVGFLNKNYVESAFIAAALYIGFNLFPALFEKSHSKSEILGGILFLLIPAILLALASGITAKIFNGAIVKIGN